jgi:hypothetical protein
MGLSEETKAQLEALRRLCIKDTWGEQPPPHTGILEEDMRTAKMLAKRVSDLEDRLLAPEAADMDASTLAELQRRFENAVLKLENFMDTIPDESSLPEEIEKRYGGTDAS